MTSYKYDPIYLSNLALQAAYEKLYGEQKTMTKEERLQKIEDEARKLREEIEAEKKIDTSESGVYLCEDSNSQWLSAFEPFTNNEVLICIEDDGSITRSANNHFAKSAKAKLTDKEAAKLFDFAVKLVQDRP